MGISILGGMLKGFSLSVPRGDVVRPTSILLRRRIFDSCQDLAERLFIDACAGSGAVGMEAWSRGAEQVYLIEANKSVYRNLQDNLTAISKKWPDEVKKRPLNAKLTGIERWMQEFKAIYLSLSEDRQDEVIFYLDPPYESLFLYQEILLNGLSGGWFKGEIWIESDRQKGRPSDYWKQFGVEEVKLFIQGTSYVLKGKMC